MEEKRISPDRVLSQLESIRKCFPSLRIVASASVNKGIKRVGSEDQDFFLGLWNGYLQEDRKIVKFVPASGAASRMFKDLFEFLDASYDTPTTPFEQAFFGGIEHFAFYRELEACCIRNEGEPIDRLMAGKRYKAVVANLLQDSGLNYGKLPKGLIYFHLYPEGPRTAMEEHLAEGALYACNKGGDVNIHFTVSAEHELLFRKLVEEKQMSYADSYGVAYDVSFSMQKPSTDTIAAGSDNSPFRDDGRLVFRPGGHGALIENLNDLDADVVFIKNIDNVVPDDFKALTVQYKKLAGGMLIYYQQRIFSFLLTLDSGNYTREQLTEMLDFIEEEFCVEKAGIREEEEESLAAYIRSKLNRPVRVCGMVRNEGEPGGGPFLAVNPDGSVSPQILESSQIDLNNPAMRNLFEQGTHFNPVDLVCGLKDYRGQSFHLPDYVDPDTGFISIKSKSGKELKALELPGLWNGAMADWNTVFVEVPAETFNPVKTVNDLLRPEHQSG